MVKTSIRVPIKVTVTATVMLLIFVGGSFLLPNRWNARAEITIDVSQPKAIRDYLVQLNTWPQWTVWNPRELPELEVSTPEGEGSEYRSEWNSDALGQVLVELEPKSLVNENEPIRYTMTFVGHDNRQLRGSFALTQTNDHCRVVWRQSGPLKSGMFSRWIGFVVVRWLAQADMEDSLASLQEHVERTGD